MNLLKLKDSKIPSLTQLMPMHSSRHLKKTAAPLKSTAVMWSSVGLGIASKRMFGLV